MAIAIDVGFVKPYGSVFIDVGELEWCRGVVGEIVRVQMARIKDGKVDHVRGVISIAKFDRRIARTQRL